MILVIDSDMAFAAPIQSVLTTAGITAQIVHERYHGIQPILMAEQHRQAIQSIFVNLHPKTRPVLGPSLLIAKLRVIVPHARITAQTDDPAVAWCCVELGCQVLPQSASRDVVAHTVVTGLQQAPRTAPPATPWLEALLAQAVLSIQMVIDVHNTRQLMSQALAKYPNRQLAQSIVKLAALA